MSSSKRLFAIADGFWHLYLVCYGGRVCPPTPTPMNVAAPNGRPSGDFSDRLLIHR